MHDPLTLAFRVPFPWFTRCRVTGERRWWTFAEIWHKDPCRGGYGDEDSCGWFGPNLTKEQASALKFFAGQEARKPTLQLREGKESLDPTRDVVLAEIGFRQIAGVVEPGRGLRGRPVQEWARDLATPMHGSRCDLFVYLESYHSNHPGERGREQHAEHMYRVLARKALREMRPWWRHPRFHVHHWRLKFPIVSWWRWRRGRAQYRAVQEAGEGAR